MALEPRTAGPGDGGVETGPETTRYSIVRNDGAGAGSARMRLERPDGICTAGRATCPSCAAQPLRPCVVPAGRCRSLGRAVKPSEETDPLPAVLCGLLVADLLPVLSRHNNTAPGGPALLNKDR